MRICNRRRIGALLREVEDEWVNSMLGAQMTDTLIVFT